LPVEAGLTFPLKEDYDRVNSGFLDPRFYDVEVKDDEEDPVGAPRLDKAETKPEEPETKEEGEIKTEPVLEQEMKDIPRDEDRSVVPLKGEHDPYLPLPPNGEEPRPRYTTFRHPLGHLVQVDRKDRPYRVDSEGTRLFEHAGRPSYMPPEDWPKCRREAKKVGQTVLQYLDIPDPGAGKSSTEAAAAVRTVGEITDDEDDATEEWDHPGSSSVGLASPTLKGGDTMGQAPRKSTVNKSYRC